MEKSGIILYKKLNSCSFVGKTLCFYESICLENRLVNAENMDSSFTMEGPLSKWTNLVNGWQYRWFVLDISLGVLSYYTVSRFQHNSYSIYHRKMYLIFIYKQFCRGSGSTETSMVRNTGQFGEHKRSIDKQTAIR
ncbi:unnamed protein product [Heterobilharzia americana]|nr:unnamed protein product [Heterobilharzia americana]